MTKILILDGDELLTAMNLKDKLIFILTHGKVYHLDTSDGEMWQAKKNLSNLGKTHQKIIRTFQKG